MGWFNEQLKSRIKRDKNDFENSVIGLSSVILGESEMSKALNNDRQKTKNAIEEVLTYYKAKIIDLPQELDDMNEQLEYLLRPTGIMRRTVELKGTWWKDAIGAMIAQTKSGDTVALIPNSLGKYSFFDYETGKRVKINSKTKDMLEEKAFCFYKPFPLKKLKLLDLNKYMFSTLNKTDFIYIICMAGLLQLFSMILPPIQKALYGGVIPSGNISLLAPFACLLVGMTLSKQLISIANSLIQARISTKMNLSVQAATMNRVISLPATFFSKYSSGDLSSRVGGVQQVCTMLSSTIFGTGLATLCSFAYIFQMGSYAPQLVIPAMTYILIQLVLTIFLTLMGLKIGRKKMNIGIKLHGLVYSLFSGIQKIKLSGAERRAFSKWANTYKESAELSYNPPAFLKVGSMVPTIVSMVGMIIIYFVAGTTGVTLADFMAFSVAFSGVSGAIMALAPLATKYAEMKPMLEVIEPILDTEPEVSENKKIITKLSGGIEIDNISFRYNENSPMILHNISLKIKPGQYVAIVGKTGCGKSTLMRLLLGFEKPLKGAIYYDGQDVNSLDLKSLRQNIGAVMQNGKLFQGDIYSNIVISAPWLNLDSAWEAAKLASIDEDIKDMPMGMHTIISEGSGGVSGGQKQRLMIARAIAPRPSILMFDEATSALDNITQKQISQSLDELNSTRIVIAHRLSTIKNCDRIIVLDKGHIIEDGKYDELIANNGYFAELVKRQQVNHEN